MERIAASGIQALQILLENNGIILELHLRGKGTDWRNNLRDRKWKTTKMKKDNGYSQKFSNAIVWKE